MKGPPNLILYVSKKKIVTARHTNQKYVRKSEKSWDFEKNEAQNGVGIFWQNPIFWAETFFQRPLETFLWTLQACLRYLKGPPNLVLYVTKTIVTARHTNQKILAKNRKTMQKNPIFPFFPWHDCSVEIWVSLHFPYKNSVFFIFALSTWISLKQLFL